MSELLRKPHVLAKAGHRSRRWTMSLSIYLEAVVKVGDHMRLYPAAVPLLMPRVSREDTSGSWPAAGYDIPAGTRVLVTAPGALPTPHGLGLKMVQLLLSYLLLLHGYAWRWRLPDDLAPQDLSMEKYGSRSRLIPNHKLSDHLYIQIPVLRGP